MYKLMIIDDDEPVRQWLKSNIDWEHLPVELVCEAADSDTAMEMYLMYRPKIIISDINIPIISGLDLAEQMQKEDPDLQFIIITGYDDFDLVRRSVRLGAVDLLSKPIFPDVINASLRKVVDSFQQKQKKQSSVQFLQQLVTKNLPELQKSFMLKLLTSEQVNDANLQARFQQLNIPCRGPYYVVAMLSIQNVSENEEAQQQLLSDAFIDHMSRNDFQGLVYIDTHSRLNCVISTDSEDPDDVLEELITHICEQLLFSANMKVNAGIGPAVNKLADLYRSRCGAMTALNYQCVLDNSSVMHYKNMVGMDTVFHTPETIHSYLMQRFRENNLSDITSAIKNQLNIIGGYSSSQQEAQRFLFEYVQNITNEALRLDISLDRIEAYAPTVVRLMQNSATDCVDDVVNLTEQLLLHLNKRKTDGGIRLISRAKEYVQANLGDKSLCLETVSKQVNLSKIYFCKLFHEMEGISFSVYLKEERIKMAKHLLTTTRLRASEISELTGFSSPKYFGYVFKQTVGRTPVEYQRDHLMS